MTETDSYQGPETGLEHDEERIVEPADLLDSVEEGDVLRATAERTGYTNRPPTWTLEVDTVRTDDVLTRVLDVKTRTDTVEETVEYAVLNPYVSTTQRTAVFMREQGNEVPSPAMADATRRRGGGAGPNIGVTIERDE